MTGYDLLLLGLAVFTIVLLGAFVLDSIGGKR